MSATLTTETVRAAQGGDEDAIVAVLEAHAGLIEAFIRAATNGLAQRADRDDLRQEARIAILTILDDYRTDGPATLTSFVYRRLEGAVRAGWVALRPGLSAGTSTEQRVRRALAKAGGDYEAAWLIVNEGCDDRKSRMSKATFLAAYEARRAMDNFDAPVSGGGRGGSGTKLTLADITADPYASTMTSRVEARMMVEQIFDAVSPRHEFVMRADYGIDIPAMEAGEIADRLGITPSRVRGVRAAALEAARRAI